MWISGVALDGVGEAPPRQSRVPRIRPRAPSGKLSGAVDRPMAVAEGPGYRGRSAGMPPPDRHRGPVEERPVRGDIRKQLTDALDEADRPGSFCVEGDVAGVSPGLEVEG